MGSGQNGVNNNNYKHGKNRTKVHMVWCSMLQRCNNPKNKGYKNYGGRGIKVCTRWDNFINFYNDMGDAPEGLTLERKDNNVGYSKNNCVLESKAKQNQNRRSVVLTPELITKIRTKYKNGIGTNEIAEQLQLNKSTVGNAIYKNAWHDIT